MVPVAVARLVPVGLAVRMTVAMAFLLQSRARL